MSAVETKWDGGSSRWNKGLQFTSHQAVWNLYSLNISFLDLRTICCPPAPCSNVTVFIVSGLLKENSRWKILCKIVHPHKIHDSSSIYLSFTSFLSPLFPVFLLFFCCLHCLPPFSQSLFSPPRNRFHSFWKINVKGKKKRNLIILKS